MPVTQLSTLKGVLRFEGNDRRAYWRRFSMLLTLSVVIATMGLLRDSGAVVIAAMLIAPMMTPILGVASALIMGWTRRAIFLVFSVCVAAGCSAFLAWLLCFVADIPRGILLPNEVNARTDPGIEDLIVALAAGAAGAYVQINKSELSLLPGAAIGVSLVPPLSAVGILVYFGETTNAFDAALLFATNLGAIVLAACAVYVVVGARSVLHRGRRRAHFTAGVVATAIFLTAIVVQLGRATIVRYQETFTESHLAALISDWAGPVSVEILRVNVKKTRQIADIWLVVDVPVQAQHRVNSVSDMLPAELKREKLSELVLDLLGPGYSVVIRYQTRFAGLITFGSDTVLPALDDEAITEEP